MLWKSSCMQCSQAHPLTTSPMLQLQPKRNIRLIRSKKKAPIISPII
uniref:Uncharacterized protein n=1 Tax=Triticum urartu TaxID=4572 RepID=A0A8R7QZP2_TRIUA